MTKDEESLPSPFFDGDAVKLLFDHVRNIFTSTLMAQIGHATRLLEANTKVAQGIAFGYGDLFICLGLFLFLINFFHGEHLLRWSPHFKSLRQRSYFGLIEKTYWVLYIIVAVPACYVSILRYV